MLLLQSQTRTPLEQQMDEILNNSTAVQEERKVCMFFRVYSVIYVNAEYRKLVSTA
jgi:hypothetical protein